MSKGGTLMHRKVLLLAVVFFVSFALPTTNSPTAIYAQGGLSIGATPNYGSVTLSPGFSPNPYTVDLTSGGSVAVSYSNCVGFATAAPDFNLYWEGGGQLEIYVEGERDTALVINDPYGNWLCDDDSHGNLNPSVSIPSATSGLYNIWVASFSANDYVPSRLFIRGLGSGGSGNAPFVAVSPNLFDPSIIRSTLNAQNILRAGNFTYAGSGFEHCIGTTEDNNTLATQLHPQARYAFAGATGGDASAMAEIAESGQLADTYMGNLPVGSSPVAIIIVDDFNNTPDDNRQGVSHGYLVANLLYRWRDSLSLSNPEQIHIDGVDVKQALTGELGEAIRHVINLKRNMGYQRIVLNMSFSVRPCNGGTLSYNEIQQDPLWNTVRDLQYEGVIVVAAAGNFGDNSPDYPARWPEVISVSGNIWRGHRHRRVVRVQSRGRIHLPDWDILCCPIRLNANCC